MAYNYQLLPEAKDDLDGAVAWYTEKGTPTAQRFIDAYLKVVRRLTDNPFLFPKARGDLRKARLAKPFPYNAYFFVQGDVVFVVAVFHDSRNPAVWQSRT